MSSFPYVPDRDLNPPEDHGFYCDYHGTHHDGQCNDCHLEELSDNDQDEKLTNKYYE